MNGSVFRTSTPSTADRRKQRTIAHQDIAHSRRRPSLGNVGLSRFIETLGSGDCSQCLVEMEMLGAQFSMM